MVLRAYRAVLSSAGGSVDLAALVACDEAARAEGIQWLIEQNAEQPDTNSVSAWLQVLRAPYHCYLHDIFGNPFRPVAFDPAWRTADVTAIAQTIYVERRFTDLPILADALEEAGCTNTDLLDHCRLPGDHVRGCWAVDLVLGKS
jgi:hypothetical protein